MSLFVETVTPVFESLLAVKATFRDLDFSDSSKAEIEAELANIKALECKVMMVWAESTTDINPGMIEAVEKGSMTYTLAIECYLKKVLLNVYA